MSTIFYQTSAAKQYKVADALVANAEATMHADELQYLIAKLTSVYAAEAAKDTAKAKRVAKINATSVDPKYRPIVQRVDAELRRLGFEGINDFAENGSMRKLNDAMSAAKWENDKRFKLKENAAVLGLID
jgi:hypothetical protein